MNQSQNPLSRLQLRNPVHFLAVGLGSGLIRPAPGTWGSLLGLILGVLLMQGLGWGGFITFTLLSFFVGCYLCQKTSDDMGVHDHGSIVWDEFVGVWLVLAAVPELNLIWCLLAFGLFRFFDILKPYPIRYFDRKLTSGFGIMIDDVLAAFYSLLVIFVVRLFL